MPDGDDVCCDDVVCEGSFGEGFGCPWSLRQQMRWAIDVESYYGLLRGDIHHRSRVLGPRREENDMSETVVIVVVTLHAWLYFQPA